MRKPNIILIGMPGCGKSTCGVLTAKSRCMSFLDTDLLIQETTGKQLQTILNEKGPNGFAQIEEDVLTHVDVENTLIATGGSAVYYDKAMKHLKETGKIVYLQISYDEMMDRIKNIKSRGILLKPGETMQDMFNHRMELYRKYADIIIDCDKSHIEDIVEQICKIY